MKITPRKSVAVLISFIYVVSLFLVSFTTSVDSESFVMKYSEWRGIKVLAWGWLGILDGTIGWYANPLLMLGMYWFVAKKNEVLVIAVSSMGLLVAASSLAYEKMWLDEKYAQYSNVVDWGLGFYLWLFCFLLLLSSSIHFYVKRNQENICQA